VWLEAGVLFLLFFDEVHARINMIDKNETPTTDFDFSVIGVFLKNPL